MPVPILLPIFPQDSDDYLQSIHGNFYSRLVDGDTSINMSSIFSSMFFGKKVIEELKSVSDVKIANFNDTGANPVKSQSVDYSYSTDEVTLSVPQNNSSFNNCFLLKSSTKALNDGVAVTFKLDIPSYTEIASNSLEYNQETTFTGVSAGLYDFRTGKAVVVFFNGASKVEVAGPSSDGVGTRYRQVANHAWETGSFIYTIFINYSESRVTVSCNQNEEDDDTVIFSGDLLNFGDCLDSCTFFGDRNSVSNNLYAFVSQDGRQVGDTVLIQDYTLFDSAVQTIYSGAPSRSVSPFLLKTKESSVMPTKLDDFTVNNASISTVSGYSRITFQDSYGELIYPSEALVTDSFYFTAEMFIEPLASEFTFDYYGASIEIRGSKLVKISFLDGEIGVLKNSSTDYKRSSSYSTYSINNRASFKVLVTGDSNGVNLFIAVGDVWPDAPVLTVAYSDLPSNASSKGVYIVSESGRDPIVFFRNVSFGTVADLGIVNQQRSPSTQNIVTSSVNFSCTPPPSSGVFSSTTNNICGEYYVVPSYSASNSGVSCFIDAKITETSFLDFVKESGPFLIMNAGLDEKAIQLCMVKSNDGTAYMYLPGDYQDYKEVAFQTNKGKSISFKIVKNTSGEFVFNLIVQYKAMVGITVYDVSNDMEVMLFIPWADREGSLRLLPSPYGEGYLLPIDTSLGKHFTSSVGILNLQPSSISLSVTKIITSVGRGIDLQYSLSNSLDLSYLYGSKSRILLTAEDND
jgi:hypothetical protein